MSDSVIRIDGLTKRFGKLDALNGVDMRVAKGEVRAFLGPNGAGKSTTIRCLLGILKPTSGNVLLFERDAWKDAVALHERIAYVPGDVNLWDNLTGGEVIDMFIGMRRAKVEYKKREKYLELFELDPAKKCRTYSKGNRQKVALVAAFASEAELFVLDEPTSGLDPLLERVFQDTIQDLKAKGKTVLLSSHIMSEVEKLADRVSLIKDGKIVLEGSMGEIAGKGKSLEDLFVSEYIAPNNAARDGDRA